MSLCHAPNLPAMRRLVPACLAALLLLASCGSDDSGGPGPSGFDSSRAFDDLRAQVDFGPRPAGSPAAHRTAEWIAGQMRGKRRVNHRLAAMVAALLGVAALPLAQLPAMLDLGMM